MLDNHNELIMKQEGLPYIGSRLALREFYAEVKKVKKAFDLYGFWENLLDDNLPLPPPQKVRLGMGSPAAFLAFPPAAKRSKEAIECDKIHEYPLAAGNETAREESVAYLAEIGFKNDYP